MAVVLAIVSLLVGGMLMPLTAQQDARLNTETTRLLADVGEALTGYAASHASTVGRPYLPCPDTDGNGTENRTGDACTAQIGTLPWVDLGIGRDDAWGQSLRYAVSSAFSDKGAGFSLTSAGSLRICTTADCSTIVADKVPAVVVSSGKNRNFSTSNNPATDFIHEPTNNSTDDLTAWLSTPLLVHRMISADKLP